MSKVIAELSETIGELQKALDNELQKVVADGGSTIESTPGDISARYWLSQFLEPLSSKELKSIVDGFLVQMLNEDQAKKLVKFLLVRYPKHYEGKQDATDAVSE